jgi:hypothetical protein
MRGDRPRIGPQAAQGEVSEGIAKPDAEVHTGPARETRPLEAFGNARGAPGGARELIGKAVLWVTASSF